MFFVVNNAHHEADNKNNKGNNGKNIADGYVSVHKGCGKSEKHKSASHKSASKSFFFAPFFIFFDCFFGF